LLRRNLNKIATQETTLIHKTIHLIEELKNAKISAPDKNHTGVQNVSIQRDNRSSLFQHPVSRIEFQPLLLGEKPRLTFACGIKQGIWPKLRHAIIFEVFTRTAFGRPKTIFHRELAPGQRVEDQRWLEHEIDLSQFEHKKIRLIFSTSVPAKRGTAFCWSVWGDPRIEYEGPPEKRSSPKHKPAHVILITADALRPDFLGVYGNQITRTPNCDQLAREGITFSHARAQTVSTLGSYASLLLGRSPIQHTITTEWGSIPRELTSLPKYLHQHGYQTLLVPSELELTERKAGVTNLFEDFTECIGNPTQDGSITTRTAIKQLEKQKEKSFAWIQYFDTHPPVTPPEPFRSMYYSGNPLDAANTHRPELIKKIRGTETLQELLTSMPLLENGKPEKFVIAKLEAAAQSFHGVEFSDPDLAIHLKNLGPKSYRNMDRREFASWLDEQVHQLKQGNVPEELLTWLKEIMPMIRDIDDDITAWLNQVVDFRYPLAQYRGAISYFDSHVGSLFAYLKENDLFDQSTIVLTSPHGEILDEHGICFHHHTLTESCIRIPMIIKPAKNGPQFTAGTRIDGIFDSLDLFPTLTDLLGLPTAIDMEGISRYDSIRTASSIPTHDSFTLGNSHTMASLTRGNYKFIKVMHDHANSPQWTWRNGDRLLFDLQDSPLETNNVIKEHDELADQMERALNHWLETTPDKN
jgi:arylsulfatase A-like enzyme